MTPPTSPQPGAAIGRAHDERASVLMLFPAAVLVVLLLGSIAIDSAVVHLAEQRAAATAQAAANDAVAAGLDEARLRAGKSHRLDPGRARRAAHRVLLAAGFDPRRAVVSVGATMVEVTVNDTADHVIAPAFAGFSDHTDISARAVARLDLD